MVSILNQCDINKLTEMAVEIYKKMNLPMDNNELIR